MHAVTHVAAPVSTSAPPHVEDEEPRRGRKTAQERFKAKVNVNGPMHPTDPSKGCCHAWEGYRNARGYGTFKVNGKMVRAHRYAREQKHGPIPDDTVADHTCHNRACVNPAHLDLVTVAESNRRRRPSTKPSPPMDIVSGLERCASVLKGWNEGKSSRQVAAETGLSISTVERGFSVLNSDPEMERTCDIEKAEG